MNYLKTLSIVLILIVSGCKTETKQKMDSKMNDEKSKVVKTEKTSQKKPLSPNEETMAMIGDIHIHIKYSSPGVRGRVIFGGLVGYDSLWRAGAHRATSIETNKDLIINGNTLPAGKHGFFTIPSKGDWILIFNTNWDQHGTDDYDEKEDIFRIKVTPITLENVQEHLVYKVTKNTDTSGSISLAWDKVNLVIPFEVKQ